MKYGVRIYGGASLTIQKCAGVPEHMRTHIREVLALECRPASRSLGNASELLRRTCREADSKKMILLITPEPYGDDMPLDAVALEAWYHKFGFYRLQNDPIILVRMHQVPENIPEPTNESLIVLEGA